MRSLYIEIRFLHLPVNGRNYFLIIYKKDGMCTSSPYFKDIDQCVVTTLTGLGQLVRLGRG